MSLLQNIHLTGNSNSTVGNLNMFCGCEDEWTALGI
jgi:hypothetical protein